jgi:galactokinase
MLSGAEVATRAPGRANLIGEHTDYNEGFVLPMAIDLATYLVGKRDQWAIGLTSEAEPSPVHMSLADLRMPNFGWGRYVAGVARSLRDAGVDLRGVDGKVIGDVPIGVGLSSSASLEVAIALAISSGDIASADLARRCRRAENHYVGVASGIMDQLTSAAARFGHACLIDCRTESISYVSWPEGLKVLLIDSGVRRSLNDGRFNTRVAECRQAAAELGAPSLRDVAVNEVERARGKIDEVLLRRARHVVSENERTLAAAKALGEEDDTALRELFDQSHRSLSEDFEASTPEIDRLVEIACTTPGIVASRLTGGGWGGCTINLIHTDDDASRLVTAIAEPYERETAYTTRWWVTGAARGAEKIRG